MTFTPDVTEMLARARADLRMGVPVVLGNVLVLATETLTAEWLWMGNLFWRSPHAGHRR